ncbi:hypothetical protein N7468_004392 [Penicillium chermesinum]|uniref:Uncharacterized protein n=1 Tax=Penicillium chermesinum TaxID=63820 RepID=A0A9W9PAT6_9EURO|nr:uncharacterized protein N7468_004392 [Penicillium chermesinum]KAJ5239773.1 hypothetical protein N7468_004392 [Penicillium chermesinum]
MFREGSKERDKFEEGLIHLDSIQGIFKKFLRCYSQSETSVHAEVAVLEHFHRAERDFAGNDHFIACSKPACLCCELYFRHHPARMVRPSSHKKLWPKWSPPYEREPPTESVARQQRMILSKMTQDLREELINQVLQKTRKSRWHPDSRSCLTDLQSRDISFLFEDSESASMSCLEEDRSSKESDSSEENEGSDSDDGGILIC